MKLALASPGLISQLFEQANDSFKQLYLRNPKDVKDKTNKDSSILDSDIFGGNENIEEKNLKTEI